MEVVASAPGKVLIAGGYLVLERPNAGLVLSTTARFYAVVRPLRDSLPADSWAWAWTDVKVTSPQLSREATYKLSLMNSTLQLTSARESTNPFVEQAIQFSIAAAKTTIIDKGRRDAVDKLLLQGLNITILGCNDFYSYRKQIEACGLPLTPEVLLSLPPFSSITFNSEVGNGTATGEKCKPEVAKTGLGSSAAMTTSVVAALLHYLGAVNLSCPGQSSGDNATGRGLDLVHAIAQSAHCIAQGKIGSGFDVSAAVYGSQRYVRFSPEILSSAQATGGTSLPDVVSDIVTQRWDHEIKQFSLPPLMTLLLGEPGTGGSSTPSMVGSVKRWQKSDPVKSKDTWRKLAIANSALENQLRILKGLSENHWEAYESVLRSCSRLPYGKWTEVATNQDQELVVRSLLAARDASLEIRLHMREMGIAAGVPIEPDSQTQLLDATMNMEGVLLAGVPGAGGFDAVFSVTLGDANNVVANAWSSAGILPLLVQEDCRGVSLEDADPRTRGVSAAVYNLRRSSPSWVKIMPEQYVLIGVHPLFATVKEAVQMIREYLKDEPWLTLLYKKLQLDINEITVDATTKTGEASLYVDSCLAPALPSESKTANGSAKSSKGRPAKKPKIEVVSKNFKDMFRRASQRVDQDHDAHLITLV